MELEIPAEDYSLDESLAPSFVSSLYVKKRDGLWTKVVGCLSGQLEFIQSKPSVVIVRSKASVDEEELWRIAIQQTGLWRGSFERMTKDLPPGLREAADGLARAHPGVRIPIAPTDFTHILTAVALSKRADYPNLVLRWCERLWRRFQGDLGNIVSSSPEELRDIGTSYQLFDMVKTLKAFLDIPKGLDRLPKELLKKLPPFKEPVEGFLLKAGPDVTRLILLNLCFGLGPKTTDSLILSTFEGGLRFIPCDSHFRTVTTRLGLLEAKGTELPQKAFCKRYACDRLTSSCLSISECPRSNSCLRSRFLTLGDLGAWFQTLTYLQGREYCRRVRPYCERCPLARICEFGNVYLKARRKT